MLLLLLRITVYENVYNYYIILYYYSLIEYNMFFIILLFHRRCLTTSHFFPIKKYFLFSKYTLTMYSCTVFFCYLFYRVCHTIMASEFTSFMAAMLFAIHPIHTEAVSIIQLFIFIISYIKSRVYFGVLTL